MILVKTDEQGRFVTILVDEYDAQAIIEGKIDDNMRELMETVVKQLRFYRERSEVET